MEFHSEKSVKQHLRKKGFRELQAGVWPEQLPSELPATLRMQQTR